ncbi:hypothetical protein ABT127_34800 [Streptomyces sp. NPDC001904]|uniref:hypothetical protein n=1 Tax=Streptomyces sp. NPDC001904 TaxID=3154531 RepID=UPI0033187F75
MIKQQLNKVHIAATLGVASLRRRAEAAQEEIRERGDRGEGVPTVIIIVATIVGALLIAGGLAALYSKANGKLGDIDLG